MLLRRRLERHRRRRGRRRWRRSADVLEESCGPFACAIRVSVVVALRREGSMRE